MPPAHVAAKPTVRFAPIPAMIVSEWQDEPLTDQEIAAAWYSKRDIKRAKQHCKRVWERIVNSTDGQCKPIPRGLDRRTPVRQATIHATRRAVLDYCAVHQRAGHVVGDYADDLATMYSDLAYESQTLAFILGLLDQKQAKSVYEQQEEQEESKQDEQQEQPSSPPTAKSTAGTSFDPTLLDCSPRRKQAVLHLFATSLASGWLPGGDAKSPQQKIPERHATVSVSATRPTLPPKTMSMPWSRIPMEDHHKHKSTTTRSPSRRMIRSQ